MERRLTAAVPPSPQPPASRRRGSGHDEPFGGGETERTHMPGAEDKFVQALIEGGPDGYTLVESKMSRGSTHDKDRTTFTKLVDSDSLTGELEDLRTAQKLDMSDRRAYDPENNPNEAGHK